MSRILLTLVMIMGLAIFGCGDQPDQSDDAAADRADDVDVADDARDHAPIDDTDDADDADDHARIAGGGDISIETPELEVGQWIEFGADEMAETVTISVVGSEQNQGDECLWVQFSGADFVAQVLVEPSTLDIAMESYENQLDDFFADPADYIRSNMGDAQDMAAIFGNEESMDIALDLISAIRMIKFDQGGGAIMAIDMEGVPEFLEGLMDDPAFTESFQEGFMQGFNEEQGQEDLDEFMAELDNMDFGFEAATVEAGGSQVEGIEFSLGHPKGDVSVVFSSELPIIPLAYASFFASEDNESHSIQVRGYGFSGAENLLPGEPAQVIPAMMFLQGMTQ